MNRVSFGVVFDKSTLLLIGANIFTIGVAIALEWSLVEMLITYWSQSLIIGYFNYKKLSELEKNSAFSRFFSFGKFFLLHYGGFHVAYGIFLLLFVVTGFSGSSFTGPDWGLLGVSILVFYLNHLFSFKRHWPVEKETANLLGLFVFPYARVVPMHLAIIIGVILGGASGLILFMGLKTVADVAMHVFEHRKRLAG